MEMGLEIVTLLRRLTGNITECLRPPQAEWSEKLSRSSPTLKSPDGPPWTGFQERKKSTMNCHSNQRTLIMLSLEKGQGLFASFG